MAAISHGMDIAQIEALGNKLQSDFSQRIAAIANDLERLVGDTSAAWLGSDGDAFRSWWPTKRSRLAAIAEDLHGFGQSALNNVSEQRQASGVAGSTGQTPTAPGVTGPAPRPVGFGEDEAALRARFNAEWRPVWKGEDGTWYDQYGMAYDSDGNCTSYAMWRLNDLAKQNGLDWSISNSSLDGTTPDGGKFGNAAEWNDHLVGLGITPDNNATAGAVAFWDVGDGKGSFGHVGVVREVLPDGSVVVEESSYDSVLLQVRTYKPGDTDYPSFLHLMPGS